MPTTGWFSLATTTLSSNTSTVTFGSIPNTYRDLVLIFAGTNTTSSSGMILRFNGDTGNYTRRFAIGDGNFSSGSSSSLEIFGHTSRTHAVINIMDYSATDRNKSILWREGVAGDATRMTSGRWAINTAINSVTLIRTDGAQISSGTTISLYGIAG